MHWDNAGASVMRGASQHAQVVVSYAKRQKTSAVAIGGGADFVYNPPLLCKSSFRLHVYTL